ncbi:MFS transporter [Carnobacterium sp. FSL W8-0810]|uniref:MFS transporter n=1 Tax=Carnobacterium sp. FSL W8-0810 TaxID=2954705 RepID=UPI0030F8178B
MENQTKNWRKQFVPLILGQSISLIGSSAVQFALMWWLASQTNSGTVLSIAGLFAFLPQLIIGPFAGVWVDRMDKKKVVIIADLFTGLVALFLSLSIVIAEAQITLILVSLFLRAVASVFHTPAIQAIVPTLVPADELVEANSWNQFLQSGAYMLGPVIGAVLYSIAPLWVILLTDTLGAIIACGIIGRIKIKKITASGETSSYFEELRLGFREFVQNKNILKVTIIGVFVMFFYLPLSSLFPLMTTNHFQLSALFGGIIEVVYAFGMLLGAVVIGKLNKKQNKLKQSIYGLIGISVVTVLSGATSGSLIGFWLFALFSFLMGGFGNQFSIPFTAYVQEEIAAEKLGRFFSFYGSIMSIAMPVGLLLAGPMTDLLGINSWFLIAGICSLVISIFGYFSIE